MRVASRVAVAIAVVLVHAGRAWAAFHIVVIDQVFFGSADCPNAQYVMMRMLVGGQNSVNTQRVKTQNADGSAAADFGTFDHSVSNGQSGGRFIMGTADAAALFGISMDQTVSGSLVSPDGRVCYGQLGSSPVDCVAYGNFTGGGPGPQAPAPVLGMALLKQSNVMDDNDFTLGAPAPQNNAGNVGTLGQCQAGPTPTPTPIATVPPVTGCPGDCDGNGSVGISELIIGVNIALSGSGLDTCESLDLNGNLMVDINELVTAVNDALTGCPATPTPTTGSS